jgi:hypothetical protein
MWQIVDFDLLRTHLAQSIFYLHSQPPLLNLFLGLVLKLTPDQAHAHQVLQHSYQLIGLCLMLLTFQLMLDLCVPIGLALVLTLLFEFNPGTLMLENWFYTAYPTQLLFCASAFFLIRYINSASRGYGMAFLACAALPIFFNSSFQPIWFVVVLAFCYLCLRDRIRQMAPIAMAIVGLIALLVVKNAIVFGVYTTSSWFGMNLARVTMPQISWDARVQDTVTGKVSKFATIPPFQPLEIYPIRRVQPTGIAVLDTRRKANGAGNYNNILYIDISRHYLHDALWSLAHHPGGYMREMARTSGCYFGTYKDQESRTSSRLGEWNYLYDLILQPASLSWWPRHYRCGTVSLTLLMGLPAIFVLAVLRLARTEVWNSSDLATASMLITIAYTSAMAVMFEVGENPRFRSVVDPLFLVLFGMVIGDFYRRVLSYRNHDPSTHSRGADA